MFGAVSQIKIFGHRQSKSLQLKVIHKMQIPQTRRILRSAAGFAAIRMAP